MALLPLPPENTERWWCIYQNNLTTHRMGIRTADGVTNTQASNLFQSIFNQHNAALLSTQILGLERSLKGSNVRLPFAYTGTINFGTGTQDNNDRRARFLSYVGRSIDGRKVRFFLYGAVDISQGDYRISTAESTVVATAVAYLNAATGAFFSISGLQPVWHAYANVNFHDHWVKEYRKG